MSDSWGIEVEVSLGKVWVNEVSGRCEVETSGVVLVVGIASTTSRVVELDMAVEEKVGEGGMGEAHSDPLGFVSALSLQRNCLSMRYCVLTSA